MLALAGAVAQGRQRVGGLARLRDEEAEPPLLQRRLAIAELGGDIDIHRQPRIALEPVFGDDTGIGGRAAGRNGQPPERGEIERQRLAQRYLVAAHIHIVAERVRHGFGLLVDFLGHEVAVIALVDQQRRSGRNQHLALHDGVRAVADGDAVLGQHGPIAIEQIAQP